MSNSVGAYPSSHVSIILVHVQYQALFFSPAFNDSGDEATWHATIDMVIIGQTCWQCLCMCVWYEHSRVAFSLVDLCV